MPYWWYGPLYIVWHTDKLIIFAPLPQILSPFIPYNIKLHTHWQQYSGVFFKFHVYGNNPVLYFYKKYIILHAHSHVLCIKEMSEVKCIYATIQIKMKFTYSCMQYLFQWYTCFCVYDNLRWSACTVSLRPFISSFKARFMFRRRAKWEPIADCMCPFSSIRFSWTLHPADANSHLTISSSQPSCKWRMSSLRIQLFPYLHILGQRAGQLAHTLWWW